MTPPDKTWDARLRQSARHSIVRHRNRPVVMALTVLTVMLALAGLVADLQEVSRGLTVTCYAAAVLSGSVLMAFLFVKRLWVTRRPD